MKITSSKFIIFMIGFVAIILLRFFLKPSYLEGFINTNPPIKFGDSVVIAAPEDRPDGIKWLDIFTNNCGWYGCRTLCASTSDGYLSFSHGQIPYRFKMMPAQDSSGSLLKNIGDPIRYGDQFVLSLYYTHEPGKGAGANEYGDKIAKISTDTSAGKTNTLYLGNHGVTASDDTTFYIRPPIEDDVHKQSINREIVLYKDKVIFAKSAANTSSSNSTGWNHGTEVLGYDKSGVRTFRSSAVTPTVDADTTVRLYEPITVNYIEANGRAKFLNAGTWLESSNGTYVAEMNYDGNLVVRTKADGAIVWSFHDDMWQYSTTPESAQIKVQTDGNVVFLTKTGSHWTDHAAWWQQTENTTGNLIAYNISTTVWRLELNDSGELVLKKDGTVVSNFSNVTNLGRQTRSNSSGNGHNIYLDRQSVQCPSGTPMTDFQLVQSLPQGGRAGGDRIRYIYNCDENNPSNSVTNDIRTTTVDDESANNRPVTALANSSIKVSCNDGTRTGRPLVGFRLGRSQSSGTTHDHILYKYACGDTDGTVMGTHSSTAQAHVDGTFDVLHLNKVACTGGEYITEFELEKDASDLYKYTWKCAQ